VLFALAFAAGSAALSYELYATEGSICRSFLQSMKPPVPFNWVVGTFTIVVIAFGIIGVGIALTRQRPSGGARARR
jgi:hypothetical protein